MAREVRVFRAGHLGLVAEVDGARRCAREVSETTRAPPAAARTPRRLVARAKWTK